MSRGTRAHTRKREGGPGGWGWSSSAKQVNASDRLRSIAQLTTGFGAGRRLRTRSRSIHFVDRVPARPCIGAPGPARHFRVPFGRLPGSTKSRKFFRLFFINRVVEIRYELNVAFGVNNGSRGLAVGCLLQRTSSGPVGMSQKCLGAELIRINYKAKFPVRIL